MTLKRVTFFLVSDGSKGVRQFTVPRFLPVLFFLFCLASALFLTWLIMDYRTMKANMPELARLHNENELQARQLVHLAKRVNQAATKMEEIREFDRRLKVMVNLEPLEDEAGVGGGGDAGIIREKLKLASVKGNKELAKLMHRSIDGLDDEIARCEQGKDELHKFLKNQIMLLASTPSIWPAKGWMSSRFGYRISPFTGEREFHKGIDISSRKGAPIIAPGDGIVTRTGRKHGYGRIVTLKHGYGLTTRYGHCKKILVKKGQYVKRGETIALVGNSGRSTGPHVHYEVFLNGVPVNPLRYILN